MVIKIYAIFILITALIGLNCKPAGKYADFKEYLDDSIKAEEEYISALERANSAKEVADAITALGNKMEKLAPRADILKKKYPDLRITDKKKLPAELKEEFERIDSMSQRLLTVSMKMMKYMMDSDVMKANQELAKKMPNFFR
jgi:hypothetical protein